MRGTLTKSSALGVLANDTDAEDNTLTAELVVGTPELVVGPFNASKFTLNPNGSFTMSIMVLRQRRTALVIGPKTASMEMWQLSPLPLIR